jgi:hypothetical protein
MTLASQSGIGGTGSALTGLPSVVRRKIEKTKQTRGAQPRERVRYQNRVNRNGIVVVPYAFRHRVPANGFEHRVWIEVRPSEYWDEAGNVRNSFDTNVVIGDNAYIFYETRQQWESYLPPQDWRPMRGRDGGGQYVARIYGVNAGEGGEPISQGAPTGMGIRFYEYASRQDTEEGALQLAWLAWHTEGANRHLMPERLVNEVRSRGLDDVDRLNAVGAVRITGDTFITVCPLCQRDIRLAELMTNVEQAEGREVAALRITEVNLFHLTDLRPGEYNHRPYLLGWGHHRCNIAAADFGIKATVEWMAQIVKAHGYKVERPVRIERAPG